MTTVDDPLIELGMLLSFWRETVDAADRPPTAEVDIASLPSRTSLFERYAERDADVEQIDWYEAFGCGNKRWFLSSCIVVMRWVEGRVSVWQRSRVFKIKERGWLFLRRIASCAN